MRPSMALRCPANSDNSPNNTSTRSPARTTGTSSDAVEDITPSSQPGPTNLGPPEPGRDQMPTGTTWSDAIRRLRDARAAHLNAPTQHLDQDRRPNTRIRPQLRQTNQRLTLVGAVHRSAAHHGQDRLHQADVV